MKTSTLLTISLLLCLPFVQALAAETEPNNTRNTANTLALNGSNTGAISVSGDEDWWSVTTNADGLLSITVTISNSIYMRCELYDNDGTTLLGSTYTNGTKAFSEDGLAAGTYYLRVYSYYSGQLPAYTISNALTLPAEANDAEPNGSPAQAKVLPLNNSKTGHVNYYYNNLRDSSDWYKVTTNADGLLRLRITSANGQYVYCELFDNNGTTPLNTGGYTNGTKDINTDGLAAGTYYVKIRPYYPNTGFIPYTLADSLFTPAQANDTEPNGTPAQALTLGLNSSTTGHISYYYNIQRDSADWYKVTTNADGLLRLRITSNNGQYVYCDLFDNNGTTNLNSDYTNGTKDINTDGLAAGTYYVRIRPYYSSTGFIPYTLADSLFTPAQANDSEPNDAYTQAINLPANGSRTGHAGYYYKNKRDSADWYRIILPQDGNINISYTSNNGQYIYAVLFDNNGTTALSGYSYSNSTKSYNVDGLAAGSYYLRIYPYYINTGYIPYTVTSTFTAYANVNDEEPNDAPYQAKTMPANGTQTGHMGFYQNGGTRNTTDWWKINYTGSGALTLNASLNNWISDGSSHYFYLQVYKDTAASAIYSDYFLNGTGNINLTGLVQGYYYVKLYMYYSASQFAAYSITNTFTQVTKAVIKPVAADTVLTCGSNTNTITFKCTKSFPPYTVQLYRYGVAYGSPITVKNTKNFQVSNLPQGSYYATAFADGATGTAFGKSPAIGLMPPVTGTLATTNKTQTSARTNWTTISCAKFYVVQYHKAGDSAWLTKNSNGNTGFTNLTGLTANTTYTWRVQAADSVGKAVALSKPTDSISFTTAAAFAAVSSDESSIVSDKLNNAKITAMPNPAQSQVRLQAGNKINEMVNATLKDVNGRIVWSKLNVHSSALNSQTINVTNMPNGIYILNITGSNNQQIATQKIVVAH